MKTEKEIREKLKFIEEQINYEEFPEAHNVFNILSWVLKDKDDKIIISDRFDKFKMI